MNYVFAYKMFYTQNFIRLNSFSVFFFYICTYFTLQHALDFNLSGVVLNMLINMSREPRRNVHIFGNNCHDDLLGSRSTCENLDEVGDDSVSDVDIIISYLPTHHEIIGREIRYAQKTFTLH